MHSHRLRFVQAGIALLLTAMVVTLPACRRSASTPLTPLPSWPPPTPTTVPATLTLLPTNADASATATITLTPEPTSDAPLISGPDVVFQDVQFHLPADLGSGVHAQIAPAIEGMAAHPAHVEFTLADYKSQNSLKPQILVSPVGELDESGMQAVQDLKRLLSEQPNTLQIGIGIPVLPPMHAGQLIDAQIQYLTFTNGSGMRVLTQFGQDAWPIHNEGLVYVFQGLTNDDQYYVSAFLPVTAPVLPDHVSDAASIPAVDGVSFPAFNSANFNAEYMSYQQAVLQKLNATSPEAFSPALSQLDALIASLQVGTKEESATLPCLNAAPTRLRIGLFAYVNPDPPLPNNVRRDAGKDNALVGEIQPGQAIKILEGPKCADGWVWWKVRTLETDLEGWTAEGDGQTYWLIPCVSRNECGP